MGVGAQGEQPALTGTVPGGSLASLPHSASIFPLCPHRQQPPAVREPRWHHHPEWYPAGQQVGGGRFWAGDECGSGPPW